jgi:hypothetical protein
MRRNGYAGTGQFTIGAEANCSDGGRGEETRFVPGSGGYAAFGPEQILTWPYDGPGGTSAAGLDTGEGRASQTATYDTLPPGGVAVRRGEHAHATDGDIGQVQGLVIDRRRHVTYALLQEGHPWGRRELAIPVSAVAGAGEGNAVRLSITKQDVRDLPPIDIDHADR